MGPLPHATNGHGLPKPFSHCTIPSPHQNTSSHSVANPVETLQVPPTFHFVHCTFENKIGSKNFRIVHIPDELREINTSAIFMYIICHLNFILWYFGFDLWYFILAFHMEIQVYILLFRSYYDIFGSDFYDILFLHLCEILPYVCLVSAPAVLSI